MGSISGNDNTRPDSKEIRVLVTGFGPFRAQYPINPSWEIASRLPRYVPTNVKNEGRHPHARPPINKPTPQIKIDTYGTPVHVGYKAVRELLPTLLDDNTPDYVLHIGMASGRPFYSCERRGHRDGYFMQDVDGKLLNDEYNKIKDGDDWETDTRISEDAGNYLCDFIYYTSLAHRYKYQQPNKAMFLHVPVESDPESIRKGVEITIELIRAMVECDLKAQSKTDDNINITEEKLDL
ncbi:hypothetical protein QC760_001433 [Botrytis cinerea]